MFPQLGPSLSSQYNVLSAGAFLVKQIPFLCAQSNKIKQEKPIQLLGKVLQVEIKVVQIYRPSCTRKLCHFLLFGLPQNQNLLVDCN